MTAKLEKGYRRVDMPEAGEGVHLLFRNKDLLTLQNKFDADWFGSAFMRCENFDMKFIEECLKVGGKKGKGDEFPIGLEMLDSLPMGQVSERVVDALYLANFGRNFGEHAKYVAELQRQMEDDLKAGKDAPPPSPESPESGSTS